MTQALSRAGCRVHATSLLNTLRRWVAEGRGDLVITDVAMPDGNGIEHIRELKELRDDLPFIVISAQNTITTAVRAEEAAVFAYLPKPFDVADSSEPSPICTSAQTSEEQAARLSGGRKTASGRTHQADADSLQDELPGSSTLTCRFISSESRERGNRSSRR